MLDKHSIRLSLLFTFVVILLSACAGYSSLNSQPYQPQNSETYSRSDFETIYQHWKGTPHRLGGLDKSGIDCSGLVYRTYQELGVQVARTTATQIQHSYSIQQSALRPGDLVFFKFPGKKYRHVGIYLDNGDFMHASTSKGVIISNLSGFWKQHFWMARRLENNG
ncbi:C40 family peptidase [Gynuella sunshinyii]|uniref:Cell wall-associated hydrolase (Invasion-associated protein) n=1 Tax=Gynuella sunshinyii YC6258 TaxID=1445510 RepID=A0A0C5VSZ8_9GAMM|nr:NlpC/P60 family protein [Gynuella sunshinyii]AJQ93449.1 cell wall-associated hydrolase (invasion-associated protein) [Gynuella sunshinyii YC6258]